MSHNMTKWTLTLLLLLGTSLALNIHLLYKPSGKIQNQQSNTQFQQETESSALTWFTPARNTSESEQATTSTVKKALIAPKIALNNLSRGETLSLAESLLKQKNIAALGSLLQSYLKQHPQDMDFLLLEAKMKLETSLLSEVISHYYSLLRHPMTALQHEEIDAQINKLGTTTIKQLKANYSWDLLAKFVEPLIQIDPNNRLYILSLARAYAEQYQEVLMENILAALDYYDPAAQTIRQIIIYQQESLIASNNESSDNSQFDGTATNRPIALTQQNDQYIVNAVLAGNKIDLLIDTGASITTITREYFNNLKHTYTTNYMGRFIVNTAGGTVSAPMYQFKNLIIKHAVVENISVMVLPMRHMQNTQGLLGMNFLREFDFKIDQKHALIFLN